MVSFFKPIWAQLKGALGFNRSEPPDPTTIRRMLNGLRPEQLQEAFEQWVSALIGNQTFMASVDGKAMRNVKGENGLALMLVNVFAHDLKLALAEIRDQGKRGRADCFEGSIGPTL
jgi:hypothetical protein